MKKQNHTAILGISEIFTKGESPITQVLQFRVIKLKDNMHHCNYEIRERAPNGNTMLLLSLLLFKNMTFIWKYTKISKNNRNKK